MKPEQQNVLTPEQKKEVITFAKEQFAFLKTEKGFTKRLVHQVHMPFDGLLIYRNEMMGINIRMRFSYDDYSSDYIKVGIGKLGSDGSFLQIPYNAGEEGVRSFWDLRSFSIRQLHVQDETLQALDQLLREFRKERRAWDVEKWKRVISLYRTLVHNHIDLILQQPPEVLFPTALEYLCVWPTGMAQLGCEHFAFLQEYGFRTDPIEEDYGASQIWIGADRGVRLYWDYQFNDISCSIIKLIDGKIPTFEKRDLKRKEFIRGMGAGVSLENLLSERLGIVDAEIDMARNIETVLTINDYTDYDYTYTRTIIGLYASLIRRYIDQIMLAEI